MNWPLDPDTLGRVRLFLSDFIQPIMRRREPRQIGLIVSLLINVLAISMLLINIFSPFEGDRYIELNKISIWVSSFLFCFAMLSLVLILIGHHKSGRFVIIIYGSILIDTVFMLLGTNSGVDLVGATCLIFVPWMIFGSDELGLRSISTAFGLVNIITIEIMNKIGIVPLVDIEAYYLEYIRESVLLVSFSVGIIIVYLHLMGERARWQIAEEQRKSDGLLLNILPSSIANRLKSGEVHIADDFQDVTILFADISGFTKFSSSRPAEEVVRLLNNIFSQFDEFCVQFGVEKIKTVGDGYIAAAGLPEGQPNHAISAARLAVAMIRFMRGISEDYPQLGLRIGLNTGPVVAGVIGKKKFAYDMWGDTANIASRIESTGVLGGICVGEATAQLLEGHYKLEPRGQIEMKGKGTMPVWLLEEDEGAGTIS